MVMWVLICFSFLLSCNFSSALPCLFLLVGYMDQRQCIGKTLQINVNPAAAEATLLSLSQSPRPYQTCQFILGMFEQ